MLRAVPIRTFIHNTRRPDIRLFHDTNPAQELSGIAIERRKHPGRGGQNLTERYHRLEKSLREKAALTQQIREIPVEGTVVTSPTPSAPSVVLRGKQPKTFRGFVVPEEPRPPSDDECCMSGCAICVYDLYEDSLTAYKSSIESLRTSLSTLKIPEQEWPIEVRTPSGQVEAPMAERTTNVALSAFEEMERRLAEKRERDMRVEQGVPS
ncbi:hypothetical protein JAAARDRAFT_191782 [Jaapia argillacea MUCL 33604]|uniref:Oxidoreductase-like domain-containing protein n=1 Tax=Jaapia argillacea MUCL 33604 TaxID=933084 RepID=A0A067PZZ5_9AGAM|nr:hypothetical protein JAAARDRAFT_191782 [Jaapia argillacea MUCL 33604]